MHAFRKSALLLILALGLSGAAQSAPPSGFARGIIDRIDWKAGRIVIDDRVYRLSREFRVTDHHGRPRPESRLREGDVVDFRGELDADGENARIRWKLHEIRMPEDPAHARIERKGPPMPLPGP